MRNGEDLNLDPSPVPSKLAPDCVDRVSGGVVQGCVGALGRERESKRGSRRRCASRWGPWRAAGRCVM